MQYDFGPSALGEEYRKEQEAREAQRKAKIAQKEAAKKAADEEAFMMVVADEENKEKLWEKLRRDVEERGGGAEGLKEAEATFRFQVYESRDWPGRGIPPPVGARVVFAGEPEVQAELARRRSIRQQAAANAQLKAIRAKGPLAEYIWKYNPPPHGDPIYEIPYSKAWKLGDDIRPYIVNAVRVAMDADEVATKAEAFAEKKEAIAKNAKARPRTLFGPQPEDLFEWAEEARKTAVGKRKDVLFGIEQIQMWEGKEEHERMKVALEQEAKEKKAKEKHIEMSINDMPLTAVGRRRLLLDQAGRRNEANLLFEREQAEEQFFNPRSTYGEDMEYGEALLTGNPKGLENPQKKYNRLGAQRREAYRVMTWEEGAKYLADEVRDRWGRAVWAGQPVLGLELPPRDPRGPPPEALSRREAAIVARYRERQAARQREMDEDWEIRHGIPQQREAAEKREQQKREAEEAARLQEEESLRMEQETFKRHDILLAKRKEQEESNRRWGIFKGVRNLAGYGVEAVGSVASDALHCVAGLCSTRRRRNNTVNVNAYNRNTFERDYRDSTPNSAYEIYGVPLQGGSRRKTRKQRKTRRNRQANRNNRR
jgi:hypothetical protein